MHFSLISSMHSSLFSIRELIDIITYNYWMVDDNIIIPIILFISLVFHDTFWTDKVSLSSSNHNIFYICNCLHFTSFWRFSKMMIIGDHMIMMRDRCIKCGDIRSFFLPPSMDILSLSFDYSLWLFSSHGFHIIMPYEFHFILVFFLV